MTTEIDPDDLDDDLFEIATGTKPFNPFSEEEALGIDRDRWDRPLILPPPPTYDWPDSTLVRGQMADGRRPYRRVSSLAKGLDPSYGLAVWKLRHVMLSIARRPDLQEMLCGLTYRDGKLLDAIAEEALVRAKDDDTDPDHKLHAAHRGTAFHTFTTPGAPQIDPVFGPALRDYVVGAEAFYAALEKADLEIVSSERFVVCDDLAIAGTYDHLVRDRLTGTVKVIDVKTGTMQWLSHACQLEGYAASLHYDPATGARSPLHEDFDETEGFIAHVNLDTGRCGIIPVDLTHDLAPLAVRVHHVNSTDEVKKLVGVPRV